jgi:hypothetical protein
MRGTCRGGCGSTIRTLLQSPRVGSHGIVDVVPDHLGCMLLATCTTLSGTLGHLGPEKIGCLWRSNDKSFWKVSGDGKHYRTAVRHGALSEPSLQFTSVIWWLGGLGGSIKELWVSIFPIETGTTVDGRNIQTPSIRYNPLAPKVQC